MSAAFLTGPSDRDAAAIALDHARGTSASSGPSTSATGTPRWTGSCQALTAGRLALQLATTRAGRKLLRRGRRVEATLTLRFTDATGRTLKRSAKLVPKRPAPSAGTAR